MKIKIAYLTGFLVCFLTASALAAPYLTEPSISPDRKEIAFVSGGDIWTVPASGGTASLLVSHPAVESRPLYSPDGKKLAFTSNRTGGGDVYVLDLSTSELKRLTFDDANDQVEAWSRDGGYIYFYSNSKDIGGMNDIFRVESDGGTPQLYIGDRFSSEYGISPLADDESAVFTTRGTGYGQWWRKGRSHIDESEIWTKKGAAFTNDLPAGAKQLWVNSTADGSTIFFVSDRNGVQNLWKKKGASAATQMTNFTSGRVLFASLSNDEKELVFEHDFKIWKIAADSSKASEVAIALRGAASTTLRERVDLSSRIGGLALSPDGKKVAMVARGEIFAASAREGGEATRITNTAAAEGYVMWTKDSAKLVYASERNGSMELFQYDFATFAETQLTKGETDYAPVLSPDGKSFAFFRNGTSLMVFDFDRKAAREVCKVFTDKPPIGGGGAIAWSPDNKWIAFLTNSPESRSYTNASIAPAAGGTARAVTFLANSNSGSLNWSPDGTYLMFVTSQRTEDGVAARVELTLRPPKFREDVFRDLFKQENPRERPQSNTTPSTAANDKKEDSKSTEIVFDDIRRRLSVLRPGLDLAQTTISPDGKTLLVLAAAEGQFNLYTINIDELATDRSARQLTATASFKSEAQFSPDSKEVWYLENGRISIVSLDRREVRPLGVSMEVTTDFAAEKMEIFKQGWRYMRDNFYDDKYHGADWNAVYATYEALVRDARNLDETRRLMNLMVGELNASHLGIGGASSFQAVPVGKLGLRFDRMEYETNGMLKVTEVIALSPADISKQIKVGDYLMAVDGVAIDARTNLDEQLENKVGKRVTLSVASDLTGNSKREVVVKPIGTFVEKNLLYRQWVEGNRAYVAKISGGKLGYVHIPDMGEGSLQQLYIDLDVENQGKDGVVVDIRNNNGGFVNPYVIDVLSRRGYLTMRERGLWNVPARSALGQRSLERPTVLVTNQHSLSDAEDFTEGYRALKLGKVVGEPTAGWIIFTWNTSLFDGTSIRLPRQLILDGAGKNMELNPRPVDVNVSRPPGETGKDSQLDAAVKALMP